MRVHRRFVPRIHFYNARHLRNFYGHIVIVAIAEMNAYSDICARKELDLSGQTNQEGDHPEALRKNQRVVTLGELEHYCSEAEVVLQHHSISPDVPIEHYYEPDELKISFCVEHDSVSLALWIDPEDWPILRPTSV